MGLCIRLSLYNRNYDTTKSQFHKLFTFNSQWLWSNGYLIVISLLFINDISNKVCQG